MYSVAVLPERNLGLLRLRDGIAVPKVKEGYLQIIRHPELGHDMRIFTDARAVTDATTDFLGMLMAVVSVKRDLDRLSRSARSVLLVGADTHFGMARMFEQVVESVSSLRMRVVSNLALAAKGLKLTEADLEAVLSAMPLLPDDPPAGG